MRVPRSWAAIAVSGAAACGGKPQPAPQTPADGDVHIGSAVSCPSCTIVVETLTTLPNLFVPTGTLARDPSSGAIYLVDAADDLVKGFSAGGQPLGSYGRRGGGPGEYEEVRNILIGGDGEIHILDGVLGRHTVFGRDGRLLGSSRTEITPGMMNPAVLRTDGQLVINIARPGGPGRLNTVALIDTAGRVARGADPVPDARAGQSWLWPRVFWKRANDELLVGRRFAPVIDIYGPDLAKRGSITRDAEWFPNQEPRQEPGDGVFDQPLSPGLVGLWEDTRGLLWLQMLAAAPDWTPRPRPAHFSEEVYRTLSKRPRVQTVVEVLDIEHRRVLARIHVEGGLGAALGDGFMANYRAENEVGEPEVRILRVSLKE